MVVKIQKSHPAMKGTLAYNQGKVSKGAASILGAYNMDEGANTFRDFERTFERYERLNYRTKEVSFQMSINPDPDRPEEALTDAEALSYARKLMEGLGYGKQPFMVYEHHDIDRKHYHVVSIRTGENGRKINDSYEERKLQRLMWENAKEYHYLVGNQGAKKDAKKERYIPDTPRFDPKGGDVRQQYIDLFDEALTYRFSTPLQFQTIMRGMGVNVEFTEGNDWHLLFEGLDKRGDNASPRISEVEMGMSLYQFYEDRLSENLRKRELSEEEKTQRYADRRRVERTIAFCLEHARTERHFALMLERKGINYTLSRRDDGQVFGATFADRQGKAAYKASEFKKEFEMDVLKRVAAPGTGDWAVAEKQAFEEWKAKRTAERLESHIQHNMDLAAAQAPVEVPKVPDRIRYRDFMERQVASDADPVLKALDLFLIATGVTKKPVLSKTRRKKTDFKKTK